VAYGLSAQADAITTGTETKENSNKNLI